MVEDDPTPRREVNEDGEGEGGTFARIQWEGERWLRVCLIGTGKFWDSNIVPPPS